MLKTIKRWLGTEEPETKDDISQMSVEELVALNQELGRQQDAIRERRKVIAGEIAWKLRPRDAVVQGQVLDVKAKV